MERKTFNVVFFCKKTKVTKKGKAPIYVRIKTCGTATEIYTRCQIEPERWNQRLERSLYKDEIDQQINSIVASYRANILAAYDQLIKEGKEPTCFAIKHLLPIIINDIFHYTSKFRVPNTSQNYLFKTYFILHNIAT